jgi:hypothetical protein
MGEEALNEVRSMRTRIYPTNMTCSTNTTNALKQNIWLKNMTTEIKIPRGMKSLEQITDWISFCTAIINASNPTDMLTLISQYGEKNKHQASYAVNRMMMTLVTVGAVNLTRVKGGYRRLKDAERVTVDKAMREAHAFLPLMKRAVLSPARHLTRMNIPGVIVEYDGVHGHDSDYNPELSDLDFVRQLLYKYYIPPILANLNESDAVSVAYELNSRASLIANFMQKPIFIYLSPEQQELVKEEWTKTLLE